MNTPNAKPVTLESLETQILDKQAEMEQLLDQGALDEANAVSNEIDALQSGYQAMRAAGIQPANVNEVPPKPELPTIPELVIKKVGRPYDLEGQHKFILGLFEHLPDKRNADQVELVHMYQAIVNTIELALWVAEATKDRLMRLPSNQPSDPARAEGRKIQEIHNGDLEVYVQKDDSFLTTLPQNKGQAYMASFNDWCDDREIYGLGATPEEAIANLFKEREKLKQQILFPKGGAHE